MRIYVDKANETWGKGKVKDYPDLQSCIKELLETEDFGRFKPCVIVSKADDMTEDKCGEKCEYEVTIYNDYIE